MRRTPGRGGRPVLPLLLVLALLPAGPAAAADPSPAPIATVDLPIARHLFPLRYLAWEELYPHDRFLPPVAADPPRDADGVPARIQDGRLVLSPSGITFQALRRLDAWVRTGDDAYLANVVAWAERLRSVLQPEGEILWVPFDWPNPDQDLPAPWYNALAQGTALALFVRLHRLTGDPAWLATAEGLFRAFLVPGPRDGPWVAHVPDGRHLWLEHYAGGRRGQVLNAHLYAALGLRDYWQATGSPVARTLTEAAFTTIREEGERFRRPGGYSFYNLAAPVVHPKYHGFHIRLLRAAAVATSDPWFAAFADQLESDRPALRDVSGSMPPG